MSNSSHCEYLMRIRYVLNEVGSGLQPTVMPEQWKCELGLSHMAMEWDKCIKTPQDSPCWQMANEFNKVEWQIWANKRLQTGID